MTLRELDAALAEQWLHYTWRIWTTNGKRFLQDPMFDGWEPATGNEPIHEDSTKMIPELSGTWRGFGLLMEEAERRGFCLMWTSDLNPVAGDCAVDKKLALAVACAKFAGIAIPPELALTPRETDSSPYYEFP